MTFSDAVANAANNEMSEETLKAIFEAVEPLCVTETTGDTNLYDWLQQLGGYTGDETPESIAAEWDSLDDAE